MFWRRKKNECVLPTGKTQNQVQTLRIEEELGEYGYVRIWQELRVGAKGRTIAREEVGE